MKKILWLTFMLLLAISCGEKNDTSGAGQKEVVLRFSWWGGDSRHQATLEAIKLFEEKNPGIKIKAEYSGWDGHFEKISTQMGGKTAPDVMQMDWNWLYIFSKTGEGFYDINELKDEFNLSNYDEKSLESTTIKGKLNAIPGGTNAMAFYYNQNLYKKAGLELPKTTEELFAAAKVFREKFGEGVYPLTLETADSGYLFILKYYLEQKYNKTLIGPDNKIAVTQEELTDGLLFCKSLVDAGVTNSSRDIAGGGNMNTENDPAWINGKLGGTYSWSSNISIFEDTLKSGEVVSGDFITGMGQYNSAFIKPTQVFVINKNTKYPQEAAKFLNFLLSDPEAAKILGTVRGIPLNKAAYDLLVQDDLIEGVSAQGLEKAVKFAGPNFSPYTEDERVRKLVLSYSQKIDYGELTPEQAGAEMYAELEKILLQITK